MREKISITLSKEVLNGIDRIVEPKWRMCSAIKRTKSNAGSGHFQDKSHVRILRQERRLMALMAMQNTLAGMNPSCDVLRPIMQMMTLLTVASAHPSQQRRPTRTVDAMVNTQDR